MNHPDIDKARRHGDPIKCLKSTLHVYGGESDETHAEFYETLHKHAAEFDPEPPMYNLYCGEMHGHTNLSDGLCDIDTYFKRLRDDAGLDFAAVADHDHGGPCHAELWVGGKESKWEQIKKKVREYYEPHKFTTLLAYERDSWPFYGNAVIYYKGHDGEMFRGETDGMLRAHELRALLERDDIIIVPHDSYSFECGTDFAHLPSELLPSHLELYSRGDAAEYMGNPAFDFGTAFAGGFWQDALRRGARMACIGASDSHSAKDTGGTVDNRRDYPAKYSGVTGVWAESNTAEAIFDAIKKRRCYCFMCGDSTLPHKGRIEIDFRINAHYMGEEFSRGGDLLTVFFNIKADSPIKWATLVKNCSNYIMLKKNRQTVIDYHQEEETDCYYLRVELEDGRFGWSSPIWVNR